MAGSWQVGTWKASWLMLLGLLLWIDTLDLGGGSVLGNVIDRGVGHVLIEYPS